MVKMRIGVVGCALLGAIGCSSREPGSAEGVAGATTHTEAQPTASVQARRIVQVFRANPSFAARFPVGASLLATADGFHLVGQRQASLDARLPRDARGASHLSVVGRADTWIDVAPELSRTATGEPVDGAVIYRDAAQDTDLALAATSDAVEELRVLRSERAGATAAWHVAFGPDIVRVQANGATLEAVDARGFHWLRTAPMFAEDAAGKRLEIRLDVTPESGGARVVARVDTGAARYPITVDPVWLGPYTMSAIHDNPAGAVLVSGKALIIGGGSPGGNITGAVDVYTPGTGLGTGTAMPTARGYASAVLLPGGDVVVLGGATSTSYTPTAVVERLNGSTLAWTAGGTLKAARSSPAVLLSKTTGKILVVGGYDGASSLSTCELYDPGAGTAVSAKPMAKARTGFVLVELADGRVLAAGGSDGSSLLTSAELYDPGTDTWATVGSMSVPHDAFAGARLADGKVMVANGYTALGSPAPRTAVAEVFNPTTLAWSKAKDCNHTHLSNQLVALPNGRVLDVGDTLGAAPEVYDATTDTWIDTPALSTPRGEGIALRLSGGGVLFAGGSTATTGQASVDLFMLSAGEPCTGNGQCNSGFCVDGVCCDTACDTACEACTAAKKFVGSDGTCGMAKDGADPRGKCVTDAPSSCGFSGLCEAGGCAQFDATTVCLAASCSGAIAKAPSKCDHLGNCVAGATTPCGGGLTCNGTTCKTTCTSSSDCSAGSSNAYCDTSSSCAAKKADGQPCTAAGQCLSGSCAGAGNTCGVATVVDAGGDSADASDTGPVDSGTDTNPGDTNPGDSSTDSTTGDAAETSPDTAVPDTNVPDTVSSPDTAVQDATDGSTSTCAKGGAGTVCGDGMVVDDTCTCVKAKATPDTGCACSLPDTSRSEAGAGGLAAMLAGALALTRRRRGRSAR